ncbi:hypothetical protein [Amycolatopsis sp. cmx-11-51]|uniref:hypothetical protein n=1 Tax=Amycolatopsis sp. cmx-11-51 TaxID=2785797 RepID=UPI0039E2AD89
MNMHYGTHPNSLRPLFDAIGSDRRVLVRQLTLVEDNEYGSVSVNRFPIDLATTGAKDWSVTRIVEQRVEHDYDDAARVLGELIVRNTDPRAEAIVFWGNVVIPSIGIPARLAAANAGLLMDIGDDVWIYLPDKDIVIEYWHSGRITAGEIPDK